MASLTYTITPRALLRWAWFDVREGALSRGLWLAWIAVFWAASVWWERTRWGSP